jgi:hypothetical protein
MKNITLLAAGIFICSSSSIRGMNTIRVQPKPVAGTNMASLQLDKFIFEKEKELRKALSLVIASAKSNVNEARKKFMTSLEEVTEKKPQSIKNKFITRFVQLADQASIMVGSIGDIMPADPENYRKEKAEIEWNQIMQNINPPESCCVIL